MADEKQATASFEDSIKELENIVERLEQGDLSLEEALTHFERGVSLTKTSQQALHNAEQKVKILLQNKDEESLVDWQTDNNVSE
jgi:exodeoxyribonuclease VII small subunit